PRTALSRMALIGRCAAARGPPGWVANPTTRRRTSTRPPDHAPSNIQKWRVLTAHTRHFWLFDVGQLPRAGGWRMAAGGETADGETAGGKAAGRRSPRKHPRGGPVEDGDGFETAQKCHHPRGAPAHVAGGCERVARPPPSRRPAP